MSSGLRTLKGKSQRLIELVMKITYEVTYDVHLEQGRMK